MRIMMSRLSKMKISNYFAIAILSLNLVYVSIEKGNAQDIQVDTLCP